MSFSSLPEELKLEVLNYLKMKMKIIYLFKHLI